MDTEWPIPSVLPSPSGPHVVLQSDPTEEDHSKEGRRRPVESSLLIWSVQGVVAQSSKEEETPYDERKTP